MSFSTLDFLYDQIIRDRQRTCRFRRTADFPGTGAGNPASGREKHLSWPAADFRSNRDSGPTDPGKCKF